METILQQLFDSLVALIIGAAFFVIGSVFVSLIIKRIVKGARSREAKVDIKKRQDTLSILCVNIWRGLVIVVVLLRIFMIFFPETNLASLFAGAGIVGIALGFGAQTLIKDFISGIFIISENQYRVGDIIDIEGFSGTVERISTLSTVLRDASGNVHFFPNGMIQHVINKTMGYSMARFMVSLHPATDIEKVSSLIDEVGQILSKERDWKHRVIEAPKYISISDINGNAIELIISGKTQPSDQWAVAAEMRRRLLERFEKEHIKLAVQPFALAPKAK